MIRCLVVAVVAALALTGSAQASQLIDRGATGVTLKVNAKRQALVEYRAHGRERHVLAWGAINARHPDPSVPQVKFRVDYSGGWGTYGHVVWPGFRNTCRPYDGPKIAWFVTGCKAADGSYWALQAWQVELPSLGFDPWLPNQREKRLVLSHWTGPVARIQAFTDWVWGGRWHQLFGRLTYHGVPVHGFRSTDHGEVLDGYGRNLYARHVRLRVRPGLAPRERVPRAQPERELLLRLLPPRPDEGRLRPSARAGAATVRRRTAPGTASASMGPGVTPDVTWGGRGLPHYDSRDPELVALEQRMNLLGEQLAAGDKLCHQD